MWPSLPWVDWEESEVSSVRFFLQWVWRFERRWCWDSPVRHFCGGKEKKRKHVFVAWLCSWQPATTCLFWIIFTLYINPLILRCSRSTKSCSSALSSAGMLMVSLFSWLPRGLLMSWTAPWPHLAPTQPGSHWPQEGLDQILIGYREDKLGLIPAVVYNMPFHHKMKVEVKLILTIHWVLTPVHLFCSPPFLMPSLSVALIHVFLKLLICYQ